MNQIRFFKILGILTLLFCSVNENICAQPNGPGRNAISSEASRKGEEPSFVFEFSTDLRKFQINSKGIGNRFSQDLSKRRISLPLEKNDYIEKLLFSEYENDLILILGVTNGESGAGKVVRLSSKTLRTKWVTHIPGFNVGYSLIESNYAYITAIGFVAKLDLNSGRYVWRLQGLYERDSAFNDFDVPRIKGNEVLFTGLGDYGSYRPVLTVNKYSGKVVSRGNKK